ncbi:hypothetical protein K439DRAFT_1622359 [Ramaria rubella]|nr:hypothetical protein K439DRAFT_1622359 [Ramaria rubella]
MVQPMPPIFDISVLGMQGYDAARALPHNQRHDHLNETLIIHGLLGTVPVHPTLAIPITTLKLYHRIQQWVKVLCDLSNINYRPAIQDQFSDAFDMYLVILCQVDQAIKNKLAREPELNPLVMGAIDGNNSLKRFVREDRHLDTLTFESDYFISHEYVDQFKNEFKRKPSAKVDVETEGDPTDGHSGEATCANHWRAATVNTIKGVSKTFTESGVFVSVIQCQISFGNNLTAA